MAATLATICKARCVIALNNCRWVRRKGKTTHLSAVLLKFGTTGDENLKTALLHCLGSFASDRVDGRALNLALGSNADGAVSQHTQCKTK